MTENKWQETEEYWEFHVIYKDGNGFEHEDNCARPRFYNVEANKLETELEARKSVIYERQLAGFSVKKIERVNPDGQWY
jgi:hypothetical protein